MLVPLLVAALGSSSPGSSSTLTVMLDALPERFDALRPASQAERDVRDLAFDRLFHPTPRGWSSRIVRRYAFAGPRLTVWLDGAARWHDGAPVRPEDVCFSVAVKAERANVVPGGAALAELVSGCEVVGYAAALTLTRPIEEPSELLDLVILPSHLLSDVRVPRDAAFWDAPVGSGPYRLTRRRGTVVGTAWIEGHHRPRIPNLELVQGGEPELQLANLRAGSVHAIALAPEVVVAAGLDADSLQVVDATSTWRGVDRLDHPIAGRFVNVAGWELASYLPPLVDKEPWPEHTAGELRRGARPRFPDHAVTLGVDGAHCVVAVQVDTRGRPGEVDVLECPPEFRAEAERTATASRWESTGEAGTAVYEIAFRAP